MKGFIRILEAVLASIVILGSVAFFFSSPAPQSGWSGAVERIQAQDALSSLYRSGKLSQYIAANDIDSLSADLRGILPRSLEFSTEIRGIVPPVLRIGCACDESSAVGIDAAEIRSLLGSDSFQFNSRQVMISVASGVNLLSIPDDIDILVLTELPTNDQVPAVEAFLAKGRGVLLYKQLHLSELRETNKNQFIQNVLGIVRTQTGSEQSSGQLADPDASIDNLSHPSYKLKLYTENLVGQSTPASFSGFAFGHEINPVQFDSGTSVIKAEQYSLAIMKPYSSGRVGWFAEFSRTAIEYDNQQNRITPPRTDDLFKSAVLWLASNSYKADDPSLLRTRSNTPPDGRQLFSVSYFGLLGIEQYELRLIMWRIFF